MPGPYYFAWADPLETFGPQHHREDEEVLGFRIEHNEGDFPSLELDVRNPRVGLLSAGRNVWAFLSYDTGGDVVPIFFGRLVGIPEDLQEEVVTLGFVARPFDYDEQKIAVAGMLRHRPYWDPIWFKPETRDDPDNVLESRPELWHIDRVTHALTTTNIVTGEDGTLPVTENDVLYETMHVSYGQTPLTRIDVIASVSWDQVGRGDLDISDQFAFGAPHSILTFTGEGLERSWPRTGTSLQGGWFVSEGSCTRVDGIGSAVWGYGLRNIQKAAGVLNNPFGKSYRAAEEFHDLIVPEWAGAMTFGGSGAGSGFVQEFPAHIFAVPRWRMIPVMRLGFDVTRKRGEEIAFSLQADVQPILTEPGDDAVDLLTFSSSEIVSDVDPVDESGGMGMPIGSLTARSYFSTDRGEQSIEYLIALARSHLLARARCVDIEFEIPFALGVDLELSCRKNVHLTDYRLPGGSVLGKIKGYELGVDGQSGQHTCAITIGCTIGRGSTFSVQPGVPTYVEDDYVEDGYQFYEGQFVSPLAGEVVYASINGMPPNDDGIDFANMGASDVVVAITKENDYLTQEAAMGTTAPEPNTVFERLEGVNTKFTMELRPLNGGPFQTLYNLDVSMLAVPKTIDLEAEVVS